MANVQQAPNMMQNLVAPDIAAQQMTLARQQQLADMLRQQAMTPTETQYVTGAGPTRAVPITGLQTLAKLLQGAAGGYMQKQNDAKALDLGRQYSSRVAGMIRNAMPPEDTPQPAMDATAAALKMAPSLGDRQLSDGSSVPNVGPTTQAAAAQDAFNANPQAIPQPAPSKPSINNAAMAAMLSGNTELANKLIEQGWSAYAPTDATKMANAAGVDTKQANRDALVKANIMVPVANRGDGMLSFNKTTGKYEVDPASMEATRQAQDIKGTYDQPVTIKTESGPEVQLSRPEWAAYQKNGKLPLRFLSQKQQSVYQAGADQVGEPIDVNASTPKGPVAGRMQPQQPLVDLGRIGVSQSPFSQALDRDEAGRVSKTDHDYEKRRAKLWR
jgi:hypothetical protein